MATWVIISGSPYGQGKCARVAELLGTLLNERTKDSAQCFSIANLAIHGCIGCDSCKDTGDCIYGDDARLVQEALEDADAVLVISPIYFAGVPSQLKALLDRFQPYYWKREALLAQGGKIPRKKPLYLALIGDGGDPYGAEPAFASLVSSFALANYGLQQRFAFLHMHEEEIVRDLTAALKVVREEGE